MVPSGEDGPEGVEAGRNEIEGAPTVDPRDETEANRGDVDNTVVPRRRLGSHFLRKKRYSRVNPSDNDDDGEEEVGDATAVGHRAIGGRSLVPTSEEMWENDVAEGRGAPGCLEIDSSAPAATKSGHDDGPDTAELAELTTARRLLLLSHLSACSAEVTYQFVLIIFLSRLATGSLFLVSSYGLTTGLLVFLCGGRAGRYLDETGRLKSIRVVLLCQNLCILLSTAACYAILVLHDELDDGTSAASSGASSAGDAAAAADPEVGNDSQPAPSWMPPSVLHFLTGVPLDLPTVVALSFVHLLGASAEVFSQASTVAVEKDWVVVISGGNAEFLRRINVTMRQIDLTCKMVGPAAAGFFLLAVGDRLRPAILLMGITNSIAVVLEYGSLTRIFRLVPDLSRERSAEDGIDRGSGTIEEGDGSAGDDRRRRLGCFSTEMKVYFSQTVASGGLALALLYVNVLSVGELMTSYLLWRGMRVDMLGIWRGVASIIGLFGTVTFKLSSASFNLRVTSMWSITFFFSCLSLCYVSLFVHNDGAALTMLVLGVCASRVGLWTFDMSITTLFQETVPEASRGVVGGVQHSLQAFFFGLHFVLGLAFPNPEQFHVLVGFGFASVGVATMLVFWGVFMNRRIEV